MSVEGNDKDDKEDGLCTYWYDNGKKEAEENYIKGQLISTEVWQPNGKKCPITKLNNEGNGILVTYNNDGSEYERLIYSGGIEYCKYSERPVSYNEKTFELTYADGRTQIFRNWKGKPYQPRVLDTLKSNIIKKDEKENGETVLYFEF